MFGRPDKSKSRKLLINFIWFSIDFTFRVINLAFLISTEIWHFSLKRIFNFVKMFFAVIHFWWLYKNSAAISGKKTLKHHAIFVVFVTTDLPQTSNQISCVWFCCYCAAALAGCCCWYEVAVVVFWYFIKQKREQRNRFIGMQSAMYNQAAADDKLGEWPEILEEPLYIPSSSSIFSLYLSLSLYKSFLFGRPQSYCFPSG